MAAMSTPRRPPLRTELAHRAAEQLLALGREVRASRVRRRWTQAHLGGLVGVTQSTISQLERGHGGTLSLDLWQRVFLILGRPLRWEAGRDPQQDVADAGHLELQELVLRLGPRVGFVGTFEMPMAPAAAVTAPTWACAMTAAGSSGSSNAGTRRTIWGRRLGRRPRRSRERRRWRSRSVMASRIGSPAAGSSGRRPATEGSSPSTRRRCGAGSRAHRPRGSGRSPSRAPLSPTNPASSGAMCARRGCSHGVRIVPIARTKGSKARTHA